MAKTYMKDLASVVRDEIEKLGIGAEAQGDCGYCAPEIGELEELLEQGKLVAIGGRPGVGKSALAVNLALSAALKGTKVLLFNFGLTFRSLALRLMGIASNATPERLLEGRITATEQSQIASLVSMLPTGGLMACDVPLSPADIEDEIVRQKDVDHPEKMLVIVDYMQLLKPNDQDESTVHGVMLSNCLSELARIAKDFNVPMVVVSNMAPPVQVRGKNVERHDWLSCFWGIEDISKYADEVLVMRNTSDYAGPAGYESGAVSVITDDENQRDLQLKFVSQGQSFF